MPPCVHDTRVYIRASPGALPSLPTGWASDRQCRAIRGVRNKDLYNILYTRVENGMGMNQNNAMIFALFAIVFLFICVEIGAIKFYLLRAVW